LSWPQEQRSSRHTGFGLPPTPGLISAPVNGSTWMITAISSTIVERAASTNLG